ncbi:alpha/beta hydrolase [Paraburkholderia sediminicola]|uniref:alpha/beta hydrolase n=1 Tax=Paraburkholderia sediminicola TaxID=458836 RepID=UPI0038BBEBFC
MLFSHRFVSATLTTIGSADHLAARRAFRFIAKALRDGGIDTILVNYPLCPAVQVTHIVDSCCLALQVVAQHTANRAGEVKPVVLAGHSAGAQIAIEVAFRLLQEDQFLFRIPTMITSAF